MSKPDEVNNSTLVLTAYKPKARKLEDLLELLKNRTSVLRQLGLITDLPVILAESDDGHVIEVFEWDSPAAETTASSHAKLKKIELEILAVSTLKSLSDLPNAAIPNAQFRRLPPQRKNRVGHFEIHADDTERCARFYQRLFRWEVHQWANQPYWLVNTGDDGATGINGGIMKRREPTENVYHTVFVDNLDEMLLDVPKYGGQIVTPKTPVKGVGWLAYANDTEGNIFGIMESDLKAPAPPEGRA